MLIIIFLKYRPHFENIHYSSLFTNIRLLSSFFCSSSCHSSSFSVFVLFFLLFIFSSFLLSELFFSLLSTFPLFLFLFSLHVINSEFFFFFLFLIPHSSSNLFFGFQFSLTIHSFTLSSLPCQLRQLDTLAALLHRGKTPAPFLIEATFWMWVSTHNASEQDPGG